MQNPHPVLFRENLGVGYCVGWVWGLRARVCLNISCLFRCGCFLTPLMCKICSASPLIVLCVSVHSGVHGRRTTQASPCHHLASLSICCILFDNRSYLLSRGKWVSALLFGGYIVSDFFETSWTAAHQIPLSSIISWSLLKFISIGDAT